MHSLSLLIVMTLWGCKGDQDQGRDGEGPTDGDCPSLRDSHPTPDDAGLRYADACPGPDDVGLPLYYVNGEPAEGLEEAIASAPTGSVITVCEVQRSLPLQIVGGGECPVDLIIEAVGAASLLAVPDDHTVTIEGATVEFVGMPLAGLASSRRFALKLTDSDVVLRNLSLRRDVGEDDPGILAEGGSVTLIDTDVDAQLFLEGTDLTIERGELRERIQVESGTTVVRDASVSGQGHFDVEGLTMNGVAFADGGSVLSLVDASPAELDDVTIECALESRALDVFDATIRDTTITGCGIGVVGGGDVTLEGVAIGSGGTALVSTGTLTCDGSTSITDVDVGMSADRGVIQGCSVDGAATGAFVDGDGSALIDVAIAGSTEVAVLFGRGAVTLERATIRDNRVSREAPLLAPRGEDSNDVQPADIRIIDSEIFDNRTTDRSERASDGLFLNRESTLESQDTLWANGLDIVVSTGSWFSPAYVPYQVDGVSTFSCQGGDGGGCD